MLLFLPGPAHAQQAEEPTTLKEILHLSREEEQPQAQPKIVQVPIPDVEPDRGTPRTTVEGFLQAADE